MEASETCRVCTDEDIRGVLSMAEVVRTMRLACREHARGSLYAPPRWSLDVPDGALVLTAGAAMGVGTMGFRAYETLGQGPGHQGLVAVWNAESGTFDGCIVGHRVGLLRTAGLNGVAADALAREDASTLAVLGTGPQARQGARAVCAVRDIDAVRVFSPTRDHRETFAERMPEKLGLNDSAAIARDDPEPVVQGADVVYAATDSERPVLDADWLDAGTHVHTLGPKRADGHELPPDAFDRADVVATDSLDQVAATDAEHENGGGFVVDDWTEQLVELGDLVAAGVDRDPDARTVFCSVGLAGTEVVLGDRYLRELARDEAG
ncbi:MAG: ornithine cyclodeaminase family protein [Haloglomus sp.]